MHAYLLYSHEKKVKERKKIYKEICKRASVHAYQIRKGEFMAKNKKEQQKEKKPWKDRNSPVTNINRALKLDPGDNTKYLTVNMALMNLPKIDLHDVNQVMNRLNEYFQLHADNDMKPTVTGMGMALNGLDKRRLWEIKTGNYHTSKSLEVLPSEVTECIKNAYKIMESMWENYMLNNKIQPVAGIFLGKNYYGMKDQQDLVVSPATNTDDYSAEDIKSRYIEATKIESE